MGKSRLAAECLGQAERAGLPTARAAATRSAARLPFGAFAALLPDAVDPAGGAADQAAFIRRCCTEFTERGEGRRLVLFVDDAHLLDDPSATLVHRLAETGSAFVLVTLRTGEVTPDAVSALWKDELAERIDVEGLPVDAVDALLVAALGGPVERSAVVRIAGRCQGNVLFLRELILGAVASEALTCDAGLWRLTGRLSPSTRLVELIEARLANLSEAERDVLEFAAMGEPLGSVELSNVDGDLVDSLERQALLHSRTDGRRLEVGLAHPLYGEVLRAQLPARRGQRLAHRLADAVEPTGMRRRGDVLRVGTWRLDGGGTVRPELMLPAAQEARALYDFPLAERLVRAGIDAGAGFDAEMSLAELLVLQSRHDDAEEVLLPLASRATDEATRARVALMRIDSLAFAGRSEESVSVLVDAETELSDPTYRDELGVREAMFALVGGLTTEAVDIFEPLLPRLTGESLVTACILTGFAYGLQGRMTEGLAVLKRADAAHQALGRVHLIWDPAMTAMVSGRHHIWAGHLAQADAIAMRGYADAQLEGEVECRSWFCGIFAQSMLAQGRAVTGLRWCQESLSLVRPLNRRIYVRIIFSLGAELAALAGDPELAEEMVAGAEASTVPMMAWEQGNLTRARAWIAVARGEIGTGISLLEEAADTATRAGDWTLESAALHDLARLGRPAEVAARLAELTAFVEGPLPAARAAHAAALVAQDPVALEVVSRDFEGIGAVLLAAEAAADASVEWQKAGEPRKGAAAHQRAAALAARCEGASTPALHNVASRVQLTKSERDVALLAAAGRSNKEIAEALFLSRGTVQNYLHHAYEKLGITSRAELAKALE